LCQLKSFIILLIMKKTTIIIVVVLLLLLAGGAFFLANKSHKTSTQSEQTVTAQNQTQQMSTQKKSLFDFFSMAGSQKCTFSDKTNGGSGTVYVSSGKMRGDFQSTDNGKTSASHMINDSKYVYYWTDGQKTGYKMSLDFVKQQASQVSMAPGNNASEQQTPSQAVNMKQQSDYSCGPWSEDTSMFSVPTNIAFTDYSAMMKSIPTSPPQEGMNAQQKQSACSACNQVPAGTMRNQCLTQLKCQ
jgi:hypothetical protein